MPTPDSLDLSQKDSDRSDLAEQPVLRLSATKEKVPLVAWTSEMPKVGPTVLGVSV